MQRLVADDSHRGRGTYSVEARALSGRSVSAPHRDAWPATRTQPWHSRHANRRQLQRFTAGEWVTIALDTLAFRMTAGGADSVLGDASFCTSLRVDWVAFAVCARSLELGHSPAATFIGPPAAVCTNGPAGAPRSGAIVQPYATWASCAATSAVPGPADKRTCPRSLRRGPGSGCDGQVTNVPHSSARTVYRPLAIGAERHLVGHSQRRKCYAS